MKHVVMALTIVGLLGLAPVDANEFEVRDYYLDDEDGSIWQETNDVEGLQREDRIVDDVVIYVADTQVSNGIY